MLQETQSTSTQHGNVREGLSHSRDDSSQEYVNQNAYQAVRLTLGWSVGATTTDVREQDTNEVALPTFSGPEQDTGNFSSIVNLPQTRPHRSPPATLHALQEWEGYVIEIDDEKFTARLTDVTGGVTHAGVETEIPLDQISEGDAAKMKVGSIFHWVIGYERTGGSKKRVSNIVFRDLPSISKSDLRDGQKWAHKIVAAFEQYQKPKKW